MPSVAILTTERYFPWSGKNISALDRIWRDTDRLLDCEMLVLGRGDYFDEINQHPRRSLIQLDQITLRALWYFIYSFLRSNVLALFRFNRQYLLGRPLISAIEWYWSYAKIREHLAERPISFLLFHGEFNQWGLAVSWACRDAGVTAVAYQHGIIPRRYTQYQMTISDLRIPYARHLFVWSEYYKKISREMLAPKVSIYNVGTRRLVTGSKNPVPAFGDSIVVCPSTLDHENYMRWLADNRTEILGSGKFLLRPHPLRRVPQSITDWLEVDSGVIEESLPRARAVLLSSGSIAIEALRLGVPVILLRDMISKPDCPYDLDQPPAGFFVADTLEDVLNWSDHSEQIDASGRAQFRETADYYVADLSANKVWAALRSICAGEGSKEL